MGLGGSELGEIVFFGGGCNHALCMRPGYDPLLDTMDKKRRLGLHTLRLLR